MAVTTEVAAKVVALVTAREAAMAVATEVAAKVVARVTASASREASGGAVVA